MNELINDSTRPQRDSIYNDRTFFYLYMGIYIPLFKLGIF